MRYKSRCEVSGRNILSAILCATGLLSVLFAAPVLAEEKEPEQKVVREDRSYATFETQELIVTAQKQEENIQDVPVSVSVLNQGVIEDANIQSVPDIADFIPNLFIPQHGATGLNVPTMRGISAPSEAGQVSTGLFVDGAPILAPNGFSAGFMDIERIEVLRGPQGTLYGNGAEVGVINIISRRPDNDFRGRISSQVGSWLSSEADDLVARTSLFLSGPVIQDKLFFGLSGQFDHKAGYIKNINTGETENARQNWFGKVNLLWNPVDKLDVSLIVSRSKSDDDAQQLTLSEMGFNAFGLSNPGYRKSASELPEMYTDNIDDLQTLKIDYALTDALTLTSVTANWHSNSDFLMDFDYNPDIVMHNVGDYNFRRFSEELRLSFAKGRLKWLVGLYYDSDELETVRATDSMYPMIQDRNSQMTDGETYAVFGNLTYPLTEKLSITGGLRYEKTEKDFENRYTGVRDNESWDDIAPKISLDYAVTSEIMTYVSIAKGYRTGSFNEAAVSPEYRSYDPEKLWSYEVGAKTALLNNTLTCNVALFYMDISDMQVAEALPTGFSFLTNAAEASSAGVELEMNWRPVQGLTLMAGFGYLDMEFDEFSDAQGDYEGNKNPWAPEYTFNLGVQYRHQTGWYARVGVIGYGETFFDKANMYSMDSYQLVNAKIGYEWDDIDVYLYGKNIFDEKYDFENVFGGVADIYNNPGEVGLQVAYRL